MRALDDLASTRRRNPHTGSAYNRGNQVISVSLGRSVVLTIGRLVASNPSFASTRAPAHRRRWATTAWCTDDSTGHSLARTPQESKGFLGITLFTCPRGHTPSHSRYIKIKSKVFQSARREQRANLIGLIVPHLEHSPAIGHDTRNTRCQTVEKA